MMDKAVAELEARRLALQEELDAKRDAAVRNRMGQFATPTGLAADMQRCAKAHLGKNERVRFTDPAIGTGSFYSALLDVFPQTRIGAAVGYEIDPHYGKPAAKLWGETGLDIRLEDFTQAEAPEAAEKFNLLICNPPYVRHHHIVNREKQRLKLRTQDACGVEISGLAGLYCYFLCLSHGWMADGGLAGWLIPSEFMDVNYGVSVKRYLLDKVTLLHIHRFDPNDVQFGDALVSSAVVWFRNQPPRIGHEVRFTYGGTLEQPKLERLVPVETLRRDPKWTRYPMKENHEAAEGPCWAISSRSNGGWLRATTTISSCRRRTSSGAGCRWKHSGRSYRARAMCRTMRSRAIGRATLFWNGVCSCLILRGRQTGSGNAIQSCGPIWKKAKRRASLIAIYADIGRSGTRRNTGPPRRSSAPISAEATKRAAGRFRFILNNSKATAANVYLMLYPQGPIKRALQDRPELKRQVWSP